MDGEPADPRAARKWPWKWWWWCWLFFYVHFVHL